MSARIRVGLIGCGRIGRLHARNVAASPRFQLVAVADASADAAVEVANQCGAAALTADEVIAAKDIDAVLIATPTDTHADLIESSADRGKAVLCEKPADLSTQRIRACLRNVQSRHALVMLGFNRRFDPDFASVRQRLDAGEVGAVEILTITSRDPFPPPPGYVEHSGGLFRDMMIHDLDMARFLLDEEPVAVYATGACLFDPDIGQAKDFDTAVVVLSTASGKIVQISNSRRAAYGFDQRIEVHGARGMISVGNQHASRVEVSTSEGFLRPPTVSFFPERYAASYVGEIEAFADCIAHGRPPSPSLRDGLLAQQLADAATQSAHTGQPIRLDTI
jgi:myo-inositol 2-dehydrogenase/D-chiro-inositol 1-dehydrogenase